MGPILIIIIFKDENLVDNHAKAKSKKVTSLNNLYIYSTSAVIYNHISGKFA